ACSTVPNSPVGFPKSPNPSTRSPGFSSWSVAAGSESGGFLARSESGVAPRCDRGGCGALCSLGTGLSVIWIINAILLSRRPDQFPLTSEVQHGNYIDRSFGGVFARWRGLGIPSLAQLARSQDERVTTLLEPICGIYEGSSTREIDPNPLFRFP